MIHVYMHADILAIMQKDYMSQGEIPNVELFTRKLMFSLLHPSHTYS